ncbi:helix-turn-helix domain-containing protein [Rhizobiales bacterium TNE-4]|nr:helix-turn-helix domain-containing protein [Rhizobiales bacterium TNE-4]MBV1827114.1 helix-turn-helix domain-containing protein [Rhizobiales bacterium TNE-4]
MSSTIGFEDWAAQQGIGLAELAKITAAGVRLPVIVQDDGDVRLPADFVEIANTPLLLRALKIAPRKAQSPEWPATPAEQPHRLPVRSSKPLKRPTKGRQVLHFDPAELPPDALLTVKDVAAWSGYSVVTIERRRRQGQVPKFQRLPPNGAIRYRAADVAAWLGGTR